MHIVALIFSRSNTSRQAMLIMCQYDSNLTVALKIGLPAPPRPFRESRANRILAARNSGRRYVHVALQDEPNVHWVFKGPNQKSEARIATQTAPMLYWLNSVLQQFLHLKYPRYIPFWCPWVTGRYTKYERIRSIIIIISIDT